LPWLNHPSYIPVRNELLDRLRNSTHIFKHLPFVILLCGARSSRRRDDVARYLERFPQSLVFYAEDVWLEIAKRGEQNALALESYLAGLSDVVVIIVESAGTFTELGAFALHDALRPKLLPILNRDYSTADSFINTGPIRWVDADSIFGPSINADFRTILTSGDEILERLGRLSPQSASVIRNIEIGHSPKHLLFFVSWLVRIIGPVRREHIYYFAKELFPDQSEPSIDSLLSLAVLFKLVTQTVVPELGTLFAQSADAPTASLPTPTDSFSFPLHRARVMSVLLRLNSAKMALVKCRGSK